MANGRIAEHKVEEVRRAADILDVIGKRVRLTKKGRDFWGLCPFHGDSDPSLKVDTGRGVWHCFGCSQGGSVFNFVMNDEHLSFPEAVRELARRYGVELPRAPRNPKEASRQKQRDRLLQVLELAGKFFHRQFESEIGAPAREYVFQKRGLDGQTAKRFGLGFAPDQWEGLRRHLLAAGVPEALAVEAGLLKPREKGSGSYDRLRGRVVFPICDMMGRVVSFGGRILGQGEPKYLNGPESKVFAKSRTLYNLDQARSPMRKCNRALVVEGYFDVIALAQAGFEEAVAPMGTALTVDQVRSLSRQTSEAVLIFDGDQAGVRASTRALPLFLEVGFPARVLMLPQGEDPDTFVRGGGARALEDMIAAARPLTEMVLDGILQAGDFSTPEGRSRAAGEAGVVLGRIQDPVAAWLYLERVAGAVAAPPEVVARRLGLPLPGTGSPRPIPAGPPREDADKAFKRDKCLLELALAYPEAAEVLKQGGALDELECTELASIARALVSVLDMGGDPSVPAVCDALENPSLSGLVTRLASGHRLDADDAVKEAQKQLRVLGKSRARRKRQQIARQVEQAEKAGDRDKMIALQKKITELSSN